tara:strand:+ start:6337 stop:6885 length:549 start_codon:yes stop_codon:yes gene_type:complete
MKDSVKLFLWIAMIFFISIYVILTMVSYEKQIEILKCEVETQQNYIDSLMLEIDTLTWETELWDFNIENNKTHLLSALIFVESGNNDSAHAIGEDAVGCLQIRKTMVDDVNRILKRQGKDYTFTYDDRWLRDKSIKMFDIYCKHYGLTTAEEIARCWNGGPRGMNKDATVYYWNKVQEEMNS